MVRETRLSADQLVLPLFIADAAKSIPSMPGVSRRTIVQAVQDAKEAKSLGISAVILFGVEKKKDETGSGAYDDDGLVQRAVREIKNKVPEMVVITDVCLCEYTSHGHCGVIENGKVLNDPTLDILARVAVSHAAAGADIVAPSDMMDGRVAAIRRGLDDADFSETMILSYAVKYASAFYGPFRDAADSKTKVGDRKGYQMSPENLREALREVKLDIKEGADMVVVKPALAYLDVIAAVRAAVNLPVAAFNVSGEYSMIKAAAAKGWIDEKAAMMETLLSIRRAGADMILTYFAKNAAKILA
jgi:porphobilinogen synthase